MLGGPESLIRLAPRNRLASVLLGNETFTTTINAFSVNAAALTNADAIPETGCYITWLAENDCYFNVYDGRSGSGDTSSAAAGTSVFIPAGVFIDWWHTKADNSFSMIGKSTTGGALYRWKSNK